MSFRMECRPFREVDAIVEAMLWADDVPNMTLVNVRASTFWKGYGESLDIFNIMIGEIAMFSSDGDKIV